jgi:hypothetical protein
MPENAPQKMSLRCYGYRTWQGSWIASCIDLSLMVERSSREESIQALLEQIVIYIQSVFDTEDKESISYLFPRPAPLREKILYQIISAACRFKGICRQTAFNFEKEYSVPQAA